MVVGGHTELALTTVVAPIVRRLRAADPDSVWFFQRLDGLNGDQLGLWCHTTAKARRTVETAARAHTVRRDWPLTMDPDDSFAGRHADIRAVPAAAGLACAGSELALRLRGAGDLSSAVRHLRHVVALVPDADRRSFLFLCWQEWTQAMTSPQRLTLTAAAATMTGPVEAAAADEPWHRYRDALQVAVSAHDSAAAPMNFLLFQHALLTHNRLGVPSDAAALAALLVRADQGEPRAMAPVRTVLDAPAVTAQVRSAVDLPRNVA
jgi:hypothetical protein